MLKKVAHIVIYCAMMWIALDLTRAFLGRSAAWIVGLVLLFLILIVLFRGRKKAKTFSGSENANNLRDVA
jgi:hypothetical protein